MRTLPIRGGTAMKPYGALHSRFGAPEERSPGVALPETQGRLGVAELTIWPTTD